MKISVDLDGVLIQIMEEWIRIYNNRYYKNKITIEKITQWDFYKHLGITELELSQIFDCIDLKTIPIIDKRAPKYLKKLNKKHTIHIVTARYRGEKDRPKVQEKLDLMGLVKGVHYDKLVITDNYPKDIKILLNYDVYVDDSPFLAESFQNDELFRQFKLLLLMDQPWNWRVESQFGTIRVRNWKEIYKWLKK